MAARNPASGAIRSERQFKNVRRFSGKPFAFQGSFFSKKAAQEAATIAQARKTKTRIVTTPRGFNLFVSISPEIARTLR